jgi:ribosomal protein L16 Arg81 hydroxylase
VTSTDVVRAAQRLTAKPADTDRQMLEALSRQSPVHLPALSETGWTEVVTIDDVHNLLEAYDLPPTLVDLAQDSEPLSKDRYTRAGELDRQAIAELHQAGATIIVRAAHRWLRGLRDLCAHAEALFAAPAQANIYLTPPANQSTPPHWDTHDLFILQIAGSKNWRLFDSFYPLPLDDQRFEETTYGVGQLRDEIVLRRGDALYLPRGSIHEPRALSYSAHVALGVHVARASDLLAGMVKALARKMPGLRAAVVFPSQIADDGAIDSISTTLVALIREAIDKVAARTAVTDYLEYFLAHRMQPSSRQLSWPSEHTNVSRSLQLSPTSYVVRRHGDDQIHLSWGRGRATVPGEFSDLVDAIVSAEPFTIADFHHDQTVAAALVESLVLDGVLVSSRAPTSEGVTKTPADS